VIGMQMSDEDDLRFKQLAYHPSRIPALDALSAFVADDQEHPTVQVVVDRVGFSRWYPEEGGHRVLIPYEGGPYDAEYFVIEKGAWDHEHCKRCGENIEPMTLCWVSTGDTHVILCESCHKHVVGHEPA